MVKSLQESFGVDEQVWVSASREDLCFFDEGTSVSAPGSTTAGAWGYQVMKQQQEPRLSLSLKKILPYIMTAPATFLLFSPSTPYQRLPELL